MKKKWIERIHLTKNLIIIGKFKMKLILLAAGGRAGSHFFHSLLDEHPQILQFPGSIRVDNNLELILDTKDLKKKAKLFIKFYPEFFNSKLNTLERWDRLGEKKKMILR